MVCLPVPPLTHESEYSGDSKIIAEPPVEPREAAARVALNHFAFWSSRRWATTALIWPVVSRFLIEVCIRFFSISPFAREAIRSRMPSSDMLFTLSESKLGALADPFPVPLFPWHGAHLALNKLAPSSAASARQGTRVKIAGNR